MRTRRNSDRAPCTPPPLSSVLLNGLDVRQLRQVSLRDAVAVVPQVREGHPGAGLVGMGRARALGPAHALGHHLRMVHLSAVTHFEA